MYIRFIYLLFLSNVIFSETYSGYFRQSEVSFCMDECSQYYIENEIDSGANSINVIPQNDFVNIDLYIDRYVQVDFDLEVDCVECSAYQINSIEIADDCENPVFCFADPCEVAGECQINTPVECISNYCGGCYADFYDFNQNLVDCSINEIQECQNIYGIDFGLCDMFLGYAVIDDYCEGISGCGWDSDGIDYSAAFFNNIDDCESCLNECNNDEILIEGVNSLGLTEQLCFNNQDIIFLQNMIDSSYASGIDLGCNNEDPYCGSPNPYMDDSDSWFWKAVDGVEYYFSNSDGIVSPLELGIQEWENGRLVSILCGAYIYCQLSGDFPDINNNQLNSINTFRFEYNYLSGHIPESICELNLNYNDYIDFDLSGNELCPPYPDCLLDLIENQNEGECYENSCADLETSYNDLINNNRECEYDNDCLSIWGDCGVGLGGCHYSINQESDIQEELNEFVNLWVENDCIDGVCDCLDIPNSICSDNLCELSYCYDPNPVGCFQGGCPDGYLCIDSPNNCTPSSCFCDNSISGSWVCTEDCGGGSCIEFISGDVNYDSFLNVSDIVIIVNMVLGLIDIDLYADVNQDNNLDIIDIVQLVSVILGIDS